MENIEIQTLWKLYSRQLDENLRLSRDNAKAILSMKVHSLLSSMKPIKIFTLIIGVLWVVFIDSLVVAGFHVANPFFLFAAIGQSVITKLAIGIYLYQLVLLQQTDSNAPVLGLQQRLARLKSSTLWLPRLLFLQLPLWTIFYWNQQMLVNGNVWLFALQAIVTLAAFGIAGWLFTQITPANNHKRWFRWLFSGREWAPIIQSIQLLQEIKQYTVETATTEE